MSTAAIQISGLSKMYHVAKERRRGSNTLRDAVSDGVRGLWQRNGSGDGKGPDTLWALRGATFDIERGEVVGLIGQNGAGKSTLLKILSRITEPTEGRADIYGRVSSLLEVGTGFHPELTGRENVYLNGAILGMTKREIDRKFDEIVAFSEVERFLDMPVKRYSSGMQVRLAFSVAAHLEPDILLVDEVLAVGDAAFQRKSLGKMSGVAQGGRTIIFVSHNMSAIHNLCPRAILLRAGQIVYDGPTDEAIKEYLGHIEAQAAHVFEDNSARRGDGKIRFSSATITDEAGRAAQSLIAGQAATISLTYENPQHFKRGVWGMKIHNQFGVVVADFHSLYTGVDLELAERGTLRCHIPSLPLPIGNYRVSAWMTVYGRITDTIPSAALFDVQSSVFFEGLRTPTAQDCASQVLHEWRHEASG
jgi:lipopolysaccharide transport system ATP-binding protein